jgi:hypothetical protein
MAMIRVLLVLTTCCLSAGLAADEPLKTHRTIGKEPVYKSKSPKYGLLVFGPEAKNRVWLVLDGDILYVDRNGNGDVTDPGEKILAEKKTGRDPEEDGYTFEVGELTVGGRRHKALTLSFTPLKLYSDISLGKRADVKAALAKDPKALVGRLGLDVEIPAIKGGGLDGRISFIVGPIDLNGPLQFADSPSKAPAIHLGPPFEITFYGSRPALRAGRESDLVLVVGSPGVGPGTFAMVEYEDTIPKNVKPIAELILPPSKAGTQPSKEPFEIKGRC